MVGPMALLDDAALQILFYPFESGALPWPSAGQKTLFLNAQVTLALRQFDQCDLTLQQYFKPYESALQAQGYTALPGLPDEGTSYDVALLAAPKNQIETLYLMAYALEILKSGGLLVVAAGNKAGGGRLAKNMDTLGLYDICSESRHKARVVWAYKDNVDKAARKKALAAGQPKEVIDGTFRSWPGIYGWNKVDQGSALLAQHLPNDLQGKGADFGCGYGYLARRVLAHCAVKSLACLDADWRALEMARQNLARPDISAALEFLWCDCTKHSLRGLDFIVMNPPFHEGKSADITIGEDFIVNACHSLKPGGALWMVANKHLPYEAILKQHFKAFEKIFEAQGFKVFCAQK